MKKAIAITLFFALSVGLSGQNRMSPELLWKLGRVSLADVSPDGKTVLYSVTKYDVPSNSSEAKLFTIDVKSGQATELPVYLDGAKYLADGQKIGGSKGGQYVLMDADGGNPSKITFVNGASGWKAVEMEDGRLLLLFTMPYKFKATTKDEYPNLDKAEVRIIDDLMYRHWDHWTDEFVDHLHFAWYNGKDLVRTAQDVMPSEPFDVAEFTASPDGKIIAYSSKKVMGKNYAQSTNTDVYLYEVESGITTNMTEGMMGYDTEPKFSPDGTKLAWKSMPRNGYEADVNKLWVQDLESGSKSQTLSEEYVLDYQWANDHAIVYGFQTQATQQIGYIDFRLKGKSQEKTITSGDFDYGSIVMNGKKIIASRTDMNHASELFTVDLKGAVKPLTHINDKIYSTVSMGKIEKRMIKTTDGKDMLTWVIYPPDFDPNKKYPTLLYCQGGPQSPVSQFYSFRWNFQIMAANDYIIVAPNRRGVQGFGKEWNEQISKDWGGQSIQDYLSAIDELAKEPFVDENKLGSVGASYGGYSVYMLAGIHENRFKAFISHCGTFNLESWYGSTEELFFANWDLDGPYWQNPQPLSYSQFSPHKYVQNWNTPILIFQGAKDFRIPYTQGMEAFQAAQLMGVPSKMVFFDEENHWVLNPQNGIIWQTEFFKWLDQWLK